MAAFASANLGDVSPNLSGPFCLDESKECDIATNTCPHGIDVTPDVGFEPCYAVGPGGEDYFESTRVIAERQFDKALELFNDKAGYRDGGWMEDSIVPSDRDRTTLSWACGSE